MVHYNLNVQLRCRRVNESKSLTELRMMSKTVGKWQKPNCQPLGVIPVCQNQSQKVKTLSLKRIITTVRILCTEVGKLAHSTVCTDRTFTSESHHPYCTADWSAGSRHLWMHPEHSAERSLSWWVAAPPPRHKGCSPLPPSLSIKAQWIRHSDKMEHLAGTAACSCCTTVSPTPPEMKHPRGWVTACCVLCWMQWIT